MHSKDGNRPITSSQINVSRDIEIKCSNVKDKVKIHKKKKRSKYHINLADSGHLSGISIGLRDSESAIEQLCQPVAFCLAKVFFRLAH